VKHRVLLSAGQIVGDVLSNERINASAAQRSGWYSLGGLVPASTAGNGSTPPSSGAPIARPASVTSQHRSPRSANCHGGPLPLPSPC